MAFSFSIRLPGRAFKKPESTYEDYLILARSSVVFFVLSTSTTTRANMPKKKERVPYPTNVVVGPSKERSYSAHTTRVPGLMMERERPTPSRTKRRKEEGRKEVARSFFCPRVPPRI